MNPDMISGLVGKLGVAGKLALVIAFKQVSNDRRCQDYVGRSMAARENRDFDTLDYAEQERWRLRAQSALLSMCGLIQGK